MKFILWHSLPCDPVCRAVLSPNSDMSSQLMAVMADAVVNLICRDEEGKPA